MMCAVKVRNAKLRNYLKSNLVPDLRSVLNSLKKGEMAWPVVRLCGKLLEVDGRCGALRLIAKHLKLQNNSLLISRSTSPLVLVETNVNFDPKIKISACHVV
jgi:hypothetical protein